MLLVAAIGRDEAFASRSRRVGVVGATGSRHKGGPAKGVRCPRGCPGTSVASRRQKAAERGDARDGEDEVRGADDLGASASEAHVPDVAGSDGTGGDTGNL